MSNNNLRSNVMLQTGYQIFSLIIPFVSAPYVARVLGSENVGIYSFNYSIINYFMIVQMLGLETYGNRAIAKVKGNKCEVNRLFSEIIIAHILVSIVVLIAYVFYLGTLNGIALTIGIIQTIYLIGQALNISWLYAGLGEFKITVLRSIIIKILVLVAVFNFVNSNNDLLIYIFILAADMFFSQITLWLPVRKYVRFTKIQFTNVLSHIKPMSILFVSIIASSIYRMMDKTMLGFMGSLSNLGCYEYADKIIRMPLSVVIGLGLVMLSKTASMYGIGENEKVIKLTSKTLMFVTAFSSLMVFGFLSYGKMFSILYLGINYEYTGVLLMILSPTILLCAWNNVLRTQYFIPQELDNAYVMATSVGAIINVLLNVLLIPKYDCFGAAIGTVVSYFSVTIIMLYMARKDFKLFSLVLKNLLLFAVGVIPFFVSYIIKKILPFNWGSFFVQIIIFCTIFVFLCTPVFVKNRMLFYWKKGKKSN